MFNEIFVFRFFAKKAKDKDEAANKDEIVDNSTSREDRY